MLSYTHSRSGRNCIDNLSSATFSSTSTCSSGKTSYTLHTLKVTYRFHVLLSYFHAPCRQIIWSLSYLLQPLSAWKNHCDGGLLLL